MKLPHFALLALAALTLTPLAGAAPSFGPLVGGCNQVTVPSCQGIVCVGLSYQVPFCVPNPCETPYFECATQTQSATCTEVIASGAAAAVCTVDGKQIGPIATCEACYPLFAVWCTESTTGKLIACSNNLPPIS